MLIFSLMIKTRKHRMLFYACQKKPKHDLQFRITQQMSKASQHVLDNVSEVPRDIIFATAAAHDSDLNKDKINLGMGVFKDDNGRSVVLECVKRAEQAYVQKIAQGKEFKDYDLSAGYRPFVLESVKLLLGPLMPQGAEQDRIAGCVALSGTGALRLCAELLHTFLPPRVKPTDVLISDPSWPNHVPIFGQLGFTTKEYPYFSQQHRGIDFPATVAALRAANSHSIIVLQVVGHNPTGQDFSPEQWSVVCDIVQEKNFIPVFDSAYQGFASGDLEKDAFAARLFFQRGVQFFACQSFAKNMGMYGDRLGVFSVVCKDKRNASAVQSHINAEVVRPMYSSPPRGPARIAHMILTTPELRALWCKEVKMMADRIGLMRVLLRQELERLQTPGTWNHITDQIGMFSYLGLTPKMCMRMCEEFHVYLLDTGRISMSGVQTSNVRRIAEVIDTVVRDKPGPQATKKQSLLSAKL